MLWSLFFECWVVSFFFFLLLMLYRILLFSVKPQRESAIGRHICPPFWNSLPSPLPPALPSRLIHWGWGYRVFRRWFPVSTATFFQLFLCIWLRRVLVMALRMFSGGMWTLSCGTWDLVPWSGMEPRPLHWEWGVLATGPPGKSPPCHFLGNAESPQDLLTCSSSVFADRFIPHDLT